MALAPCVQLLARLPMFTLPNLAAFSGLALGFAAAQGCSLNPQPLPPGEQSDGGATMAIPADATTASEDSGEFAGGDAAGGADKDGTTPGTPQADGGDARSDSGGDGAPNDAATDGSTDGPMED